MYSRSMHYSPFLAAEPTLLLSYAELVNISKEISTLENEMLELKESLSEWKNMPSLLHIDDSASVAGTLPLSSFFFLAFLLIEKPWEFYRTQTQRSFLRRRFTRPLRQPNANSPLSNRRLRQICAHIARSACCHRDGQYSSVKRGNVQDAIHRPD